MDAWLNVCTGVRRAAEGGKKRSIMDTECVGLTAAYPWAVPLQAGLGERVGGGGGGWGSSVGSVRQL